MGAAKFLRGLVRGIEPGRLHVIVNTGDDETFYGLHVSPDLDTVTYTLAGVANPRFGWGRRNDSFRVRDALARFYGPQWFSLGDLDLPTTLYRSDRMRRGARLSEVTAEVARRFGLRAHLMPMSDDRVRTFVKLKGRGALPFQEYFVRGRARGAIEGIELRGIGRARALPAALAAIRKSTAIIVAPSNPFVSIGPIVGVPGMRRALKAARDRVAAISPIVGGKTIKGPADRMLRGLGHQVSPLGVARLYRDFAAIFVLDNIDRRYARAIEKLGIRAVVTDTIMSSPARAARLASVVLRALEV